MEDDAAEPTSKRRSAGLIAVLLCSVAAHASWLAYVLWVTGWTGLAWLQIQGGAFLLLPCVLVSAAVGAIPTMRSARPIRNWLAFTAMNGLTAFMALGLATPFVNTPFISGPTGLLVAALYDERGPMGMLMDAALALGLIGAGYVVATYLQLWMLGARPRAWWMVVATVVLAMVPVAALAMIQVVPPFGGQADFIHAVKMGYPVPWTGLLLGAAGLVPARPQQATDPTD